ncbi:MAG: hypothetical protein R6U50_03760 [Desulfobacterales bacterium]
MKKIAYFALIGMFVLALSDAATAQTDALIEKGTQEIGLSGMIDFDGPEGGVDVDISASYGMFYFNDFQEIGAFASWSRESDGDVNRIALGAFLEHHLPYQSHLYPYVGSDLGILFADIDTGDDEVTILIEPRVGVKWFLRNYVAIDTNLFLSWATDDIYVNDGDLEQWDAGLKMGLRVYF